MNCAKCLNKHTTGRPKFRRSKLIRLEPTGTIWHGEEQFKCPECSAVFWFPKVINSNLQPA